MSAAYLTALDAVLRVTNADFAGADPDAQAFFRNELATALRDAGFVHLDRECIEAMRRGAKAARPPLRRGSRKIGGERAVTLHSDLDEGAVAPSFGDPLDDAEPLDALDEIAGGAAEIGENADGEEP